jgi:hypothetical protein
MPGWRGCSARENQRDHGGVSYGVPSQPALSSALVFGRELERLQGAEALRDEALPMKCYV